MTAVAQQSVVPRPFPPVKLPRGSRFLGYLSTTDPKRLGVMYIVTSFVFFIVGGVLALLMRAELARPGLQDSESSPHLAIGTPSTDPNDDQGT